MPKVKRFEEPRICETCRFWAATPGTTPGQCRRHAPRVADVDLEALCCWPVTDADDWCGEWKHDRRAHGPTDARATGSEEEGEAPAVGAPPDAPGV